MCIKGFLLLILIGVGFSASREPISIGLGVHKRHGSLKQLQGHLTSLRARNDQGQIVLKDVQDMYYYGPMTVGTPGQTVNINFDTGSADLWFPSSKICRRNRKYCRAHNVYNEGKSKTYQKNGKAWSITYGSGAVSGYEAVDNIEVGGLSVTSQLFGEATYIDSFTGSSQYDGILGLAYRSISVIDTNPVFANMIEQGVLDEPVFAFYLSKEGGSSSAELVLGGVNPDHYTGEITYTPVTEQSYWLINVQGLVLNKKKIYASYAAIPDSGTSIIYGPPQPMDVINEALGGEEQEGVYVVDCSKISSFPDVTFTISGKPFVLKPDDYILKVDDNDEQACISAFVGSEDVPFFILGDVFMRKFYTVFDMGANRVGFATAK